jgi:multiple sugar transport system substrate-binding protein
MKKLLCMLCAGAAFSSIGLSTAQAWPLEEAAKDYKGTEIKVIFLDRPGYRAAIKMLPEFEQKTGIKVSYEIVPYENSREKEVLDLPQGATSRSHLSTWFGSVNTPSPAGLSRSTIC